MAATYKVAMAVLFAVSLTACGATRPPIGQRAAQTTEPPNGIGPARITIFIPAMGGYDKDLARALEAAKVPAEVVAERSKAEIEVWPTFPNASGMQNALAVKETGHAPFNWLDVVKVETNRRLLSYPFLWSQYEETRSKDAAEFARELKNKLIHKAK